MGRREEREGEGGVMARGLLSGCWEKKRKYTVYNGKNVRGREETSREREREREHPEGEGRRTVKYSLDSRGVSGLLRKIDTLTDAQGRR